MIIAHVQTDAKTKINITDFPTKSEDDTNDKIDKSTAELGKSLLLETTEKGIDVSARLDAINHALGTTFDLEEYYMMVGRQIQDFENSTVNSLLTAVQNFENTTGLKWPFKDEG